MYLFISQAADFVWGSILEYSVGSFICTEQKDTQNIISVSKHSF